MKINNKNIINVTEDKRDGGCKFKLKIILLVIFGILINFQFVFAETYSGISGSTYSGISSSTYSGASSTLGTNTFGSTSTLGSSVNTQYTSPSSGATYGYTSTSTFWPSFNKESCMERQDIVMQIMPGGCTPNVVRSDLLEEQNVPVFCKVMSIQVNPLIDISKIKSIHFTGQYPKGVSGVSYYPARAAVRTMTNSNSLAKSPVNTEMGYLVIVLTKNEIEKNMPDYVEGNITASVQYDSEGAWGIGKTNFYISQMSDEEWARDYKQYGIWNGKAYLRADSIEPDRATISVWRDFDTKESTVTIMKGQTSSDVYLGGFYCAAGMNIRLEDIGAPVESALVQVNDEQMWVARGDKIMNDKCRITNIQTNLGGGTLSITCPGKNGKIELSLNPGKATLSQSGSEVDFAVGEKIGSESNVYLAYLGQDFNNKMYGVLVRDNFSQNSAEFAQKNVLASIQAVAGDRTKTVDQIEGDIKNAVISNYKSQMTNVEKGKIESSVEVVVVKTGKSAFGFSLEDVLIAKDNNKMTEDMNMEERIARDYYNDAIKNYEDLSEYYPAERRLADEDPYAAIGLYEAAKLAKVFNMNAKAQELFNKLIKNYPDSSVAQIVKAENDLLMKYDTSKSKASVSIDSQSYVIDLLDFRKPTKERLSAVMLIDGEQVSLGLNEIRNIKRGDETISIQLNQLNENFVVLRLEKSGKNIKQSTVRSEKIGFTGMSNQLSFEGINIKLLKINLEEQAKLYVAPKTFGPTAQSSFNFKVGIEKRAINLSTEETKNMIKGLLDAMKTWQDINEKLGDVIRVMKGACFATAAILNAKTYLSGLSGESIARNTLMTGVGGWNEVCEKLVSEKQYMTFQQCLIAKSSEIDKDVQIYSQSIQKTNEIMQQIQQRVGTTSTDVLDFKGQANSQKIDEEFKNVFDDFCKGATGDVTLQDKGQTKVSFTGQNGICSYGNMTMEQRRDIYTLYNARNSGSSTLQNFADRQLGKTVLEAKNINDYKLAVSKSDEESRKYNLGLRVTDPAGDAYTYGDVKRISRTDTSTVYQNFKAGTAVIRVIIPAKKSFGNTYYTANSEVSGKEVIVEVKEISGTKGTYSVGENVYLVDGTKLSSNATASVKEYLSLAGMNRIKELTTKSYQNHMVNPDKLMVKYFETAPYKGLPAEVPFDTNEGWYVELTYVVSGFGVPYDESGKPVNFYICNVGENGLIEFKQSSDDICRYYNGQTGADLNFPGMSAGDSRTLVSRATQAITDAAKQYGKSKVVINGRTFNSGISQGGTDGRCTDFMSPGDCNLMFNVCDPVICPASRCDLGGNYRVDNVVQSGIAGSLLLCLPNARDGIAIPICLSGVHAGLEGYISILNSTVQCLNESLTTGRNVGICDEVKSIYLCEFFWKQLGPLVQNLLPRLMESMYNQGVRGGGEYLTVRTAWKNLENSISYFRNQYAVNSMNAFTARSTEDIGTEMCKTFISTNTLGDVFSSLIEPDSPYQFSAWFSEDKMTTATVPAMSHYKVYYHIYAGNDSGMSYVVYLKDMASTTSYVNVASSYSVARGYVPRGSQVDEAKDFTAASGYKQLCVNINGKDECGFGKVSTSYALNSLTEQYVAEQVTTGITGESECVAGTASVGSFLQPNVQAGVESAINPELYNQGIIRVCASQNPGKQVTASTGQYDNTTTSYDRWKDVGYCGDSTIRCWLDTTSVKNVIKDKSLESSILGNIDASNYIDGIAQGSYLTPDDSMSIISKAIEDIANLKIEVGETKANIDLKINAIITSLKNVVSKGSSNLYRARALYLIANVYKQVAEGLIVIVNNNQSINTGTSFSTTSGTSTTTTTNINNVIDSSANTNAQTMVQVSDIREITNDNGEAVRVLEAYGKDGSLNSYTVTAFDYQSQIITLNDGTKVKVSKNSQGMIFIGDVVYAGSAGTLVVPIFEFQDGTSSSNIFYMYKDSTWFCSFNNNPSGTDQTWTECQAFAVNSGLAEKNLNFITKTLKGTSCDAGLKLLAARVLKNEEGGWFASTDLKVYVGEKSGVIARESLQKLTCSNLNSFSDIK